MMQEPIAGRRIVSKAEYVKAQGLRAGMTLRASLLFVLCIGCAIVALLLLCYVFYGVIIIAPEADFIGGMFLTCMLTAVTALFAAVSYWTSRLFKDTLEQARLINPGIPLTRANTADLPANDSLVRASQEPAQAQQGVLLRAALAEAQAGREGQLLRASVGGQE